LVGAVQSIGSQRQVLADAIIENAETAADGGLRRMLRIGRARLPGKAEPWGKIQIAADVVLVLITQPKTQHKVGSHSPIILSKAAKVYLAHSGLRITGRDCQL